MYEKGRKVNKINEIALSNPLGEELSLKKVVDDKLAENKKYKEIFVPDLSLISSNISRMSLQIANQSMTLTQIAKQAPHGLFTATSNPANLSKFVNGTTSTMVRDTSGHLIEHAGFAEIGLHFSVNPAFIISAGMQGMSYVSGTYYLHKINSQIKEIDKKLDELINIHHDANIGRLKAGRKGLSEIADREFVDNTDLYSIRNYKKTLDEIYEEYINRLNRLKEGLNSKSGDKALKDINFEMTIAFEANKLSLFAELIEIGTRMKINSQINIIHGLTKQLKHNYMNSFYHNIDSEFEEIYLKRRQWNKNERINKEEKAERSLDTFKNIYSSFGWGVFAEVGLKVAVATKTTYDVNKTRKRIISEEKSINRVNKELKLSKVSDGIDNIITEVVELPYKETEILYIFDGNNKERVFVPDRGGK